SDRTQYLQSYPSRSQPARPTHCGQLLAEASPANGTSMAWRLGFGACRWGKPLQPPALVLTPGNLDLALVAPVAGWLILHHEIVPRYSKLLACTCHLLECLVQPRPNNILGGFNEFRQADRRAFHDYLFGLRCSSVSDRATRVITTFHQLEH